MIFIMYFVSYNNVCVVCVPTYHIPRWQIFVYVYREIPRGDPRDDFAAGFTTTTKLALYEL